jgi:FkbH-like protein
LEKKLDFRLQKRYLSGIKANWNNKYKNIEDLASELNIHPDSFLFIDDNIAELYEAKSYFKDISILQAKEDAKNTLNILENFPGIYGHKTGKTDLLRVKDIQSSVKRKKLTKNLNMADYHKELNTTIKFYLDRQTDKDRLSEITKKTNQFNLSLRQVSTQEVSNYINFKDKFVISIYVKDKISNSGNVGAIFFQYNDRKLMVHSICLSCRVLGRELENVMILQAIKLTIDKKKLLVNDVVFFHMKGPRNFPALKWLKGIKSSAEFFNKVSEVNIKYDKIKNILITDKNYNSCSLLF